MNWTIITEVIIAIGIVVAFAATIWYMITHNPNYSAEEIMKNPAKIFDLINHAKDNLSENLAKIKEETQQAIDTAKEIKENVEEITKQVQETIEQVKGAATAESQPAEIVEQTIEVVQTKEEESK